ncbi:molybdopterin biosynthesis protein [Halorhabdus amylolytica]|uniref:molybdopterin biosynthesis protein n=1 Tax=Halorhabdus amylolytica TaxID=2559573 RepID=UPI0010AB0B0A|nr:molybdopterin biosynthesis protein [Halorhabdus amylolytica]
MTDRREMRELASPERAREAIAGFESPAGTESIPVDRANGRVLAESVDAAIDVPGFDRASKDGYAVRASDTTAASEVDPVELRIAGRIDAGEEPDDRVDPGTAIEIATGAVLPDGADAVVMVERCEQRGETVAVERALAPGTNVMVAGSDVAAGDRALDVGTHLAPRTIGLLAAIGRETVSVRSEPTVGVLPTGDELVAPGDELAPEAGEIYDVNGTTIANAVREAGGDPVRYGILPDDEGEMRDTLSRAAAECDLLLTAGSTSAGRGDVLYRLVEADGELPIHGVTIKPGKPTIVGRYEETALVGLPGYPVSALSIFRLFVAPTLREWAGTERETTTLTGRLAVSERYDEGRHRAVPVGLVRDGAGDLLIYPVDRGSGATTSLAYADGVVEMAADTRRLDGGETVTVELFSTADRPPELLAVGERDPGFLTAIEGIERTRYRTPGSVGGDRWLADGIADVAVLTGDPPTGPAVETLGRWTREWGLLLADEVDVESVVALADGDYRFVNRSRDSGLRDAFEAAIDRCEDPPAVRDGITGYGVETQGIESPARRIERASADAGLGLATTADRRDLGFRRLGAQSVSIVAASDRVDKPTVTRLAERLDDERLFEGLTGYAVD